VICQAPIGDAWQILALAQSMGVPAEMLSLRSMDGSALSRDGTPFLCVSVLGLEAQPLGDPLAIRLVRPGKVLYHPLLDLSRHRFEGAHDIFDQAFLLIG
jgi:hypothetical protein